MNNQFLKIHFLTLMLSVILLFTNCNNEKNKSDTSDASDLSTGLHPIDLKVPKFFWMLEPWKDGKLATIDGWGRFAEISFEKNNRIRIDHLINFPRRQLEPLLWTWPDADLLLTVTGHMFCIADVRNKKSKAFVPFLSWTYAKLHPVLLDKEEGLILFSYGMYSGDKYGIRQVYYNYLRDEIVSNTGMDQDLEFLWALDRERVLVEDSSQHLWKGRGFIDFYIYNRRTGEITRNKFTETIKDFRPYGNVLTEHGAMSWERRYLIGETINEMYSGPLKISWSADFEEVEILPLNSIIQQQMGRGNFWLGSFFISSDGRWATSQLSGFRGLYDESLNKRVFYHMDSKYPGGMSIPVLTDEYEIVNEWLNGQFVNHPEYGWCYAKDYYKDDKQFLRLYKMSEVLDEINR